MELDLIEDREIFWGDELNHLTDHVDNIVFGLQHERDDWTLHKAFLELRMVLGLLESLQPFFDSLPALKYRVSHNGIEPIEFMDPVEARQLCGILTVEDDEAEASGEPEGVDDDAD